MNVFVLCIDLIWFVFFAIRIFGQHKAFVFRLYPLLSVAIRILLLKRFYNVFLHEYVFPATYRQVSYRNDGEFKEADLDIPLSYSHPRLLLPLYQWNSWRAVFREIVQIRNDTWKRVLAEYLVRCGKRCHCLCVVRNGVSHCLPRMINSEPKASQPPLIIPCFNTAPTVYCEHVGVVPASGMRRGDML